jgi:hypothetical protein
MGFLFCSRVTGILRAHHEKVNPDDPRTILDGAEGSLEWKGVDTRMGHVAHVCGHQMHLACFKGKGISNCPVCRSPVEGILPIITFSAHTPLIRSAPSQNKFFYLWQEGVHMSATALALAELQGRSEVIGRQQLFAAATFEQSLIAGIQKESTYHEGRRYYLSRFSNRKVPPPFASDTFSFFYFLTIIRDDLGSFLSDFSLCLCVDIVRSLLVRRTARDNDNSAPPAAQPSSAGSALDNLQAAIVAWMNRTFPSTHFVFDIQLII